MRGPTNAFTAVVEMRSNSRNSGRISDDTLMKAPGIISSTRRLARAS
jgi:hypothetical protein